MPEHPFICEHCGWRTSQYASAVGHPCPKNKSESITPLTRLDDPDVSPVDICCDGCDAERLGADPDIHAYSDKMAKASATAAGWSCTKKADYCPRCVAERKVA